MSDIYSAGLGGFDLASLMAKLGVTPPVQAALSGGLADRATPVSSLADPKAGAVSALDQAVPVSSLPDPKTGAFTMPAAPAPAPSTTQAGSSKPQTAEQILEALMGRLDSPNAVGDGKVFPALPVSYATPITALGGQQETSALDPSVMALGPGGIPTWSQDYLNKISADAQKYYIDPNAAANATRDATIAKLGEITHKQDEAAGSGVARAVLDAMGAAIAGPLGAGLAGSLGAGLSGANLLQSLEAGAMSGAGAALPGMMGGKLNLTGGFAGQGVGGLGGSGAGALGSSAADFPASELAGAVAPVTVTAGGGALASVLGAGVGGLAGSGVGGASGGSVGTAADPVNSVGEVVVTGQPAAPGLGSSVGSGVGAGVGGLTATGDWSGPAPSAPELTVTAPKTAPPETGPQVDPATILSSVPGLVPSPSGTLQGPPQQPAQNNNESKLVQDILKQILGGGGGGGGQSPPGGGQGGRPSVPDPFTPGGGSTGPQTKPTTTPTTAPSPTGTPDGSPGGGNPFTVPSTSTPSFRSSPTTQSGASGSPFGGGGSGPAGLGDINLKGSAAPDIYPWSTVV